MDHSTSATSQPALSDRTDRSVDAAEPASVRAVRARSRAWIATFNRGDVDGCVAAYTADATMEAKPMGTFHGTAAIDGFWRPLMTDGASELIYSNVKLHMVDERTVLLSADWSMNIGSGVITEERWVLQDDGRWLLEFDAFEMTQQA